MAPVGSHVVLVTHGGVPVDALVIGSNPDGTLNLLTLSQDPKRQKLLGSADYAHGIDRHFSIPDNDTKAKAFVEAEVERAKREERDVRQPSLKEMIDAGGFYCHPSMILLGLDENGQVRVSGLFPSYSRSTPLPDPPAPVDTKTAESQQPPPTAADTASSASDPATDTPQPVGTTTSTE